tara:strand:- start:353 stop:991 length:639 start_codon:yes stop_codon:yes gene_type:complete
MKNSLFIFGTKNFINSLNEVKEYLNFSLMFYDKNTFSESTLPVIYCTIVEEELCNDPDILRLINKEKYKPLLLIKNTKNTKHIIRLSYDDVVTLPLNIKDIINKITNLVTVKKFNQNSSISIKEYVIDKNERKLKKDNLSVTITEREVQLIELLFNEKKPISKNIILKKVWKYADDVDTHTIETHIYRLRKKILSKFKDKNFIINSKAGYSI